MGFEQDSPRDASNSDEWGNPPTESRRSYRIAGRTVHETSEVRQPVRTTPPRIAALAVLLVSLLATGSANAKVKNFDLTYLPPNDVYGMCEVEPIVPTTSDPKWGFHAGAACMKIPKWAVDAKLKNIDDLTSPEVDFSWYFLDKDWHEVGTKGVDEDPAGYLTTSGDNHGGGCSKEGSPGTPWLKVPKGAKYFYIFVHGYAWTPISDCAVGTGATTGTITLSFRS